MDKERTEAQQVRRISMKSWPKTKNGYSTSSAVVDELEVSPPTKCPRYSGDDTTMYLRKKIEKDFTLTKEELHLKKE